MCVFYSQPSPAVQQTGTPTTAVMQPVTQTVPQPMAQPTVQPTAQPITQGVIPGTPPSTVLSLADVFVPLETVQPGKSLDHSHG